MSTFLSTCVPLLAIVIAGLHVRIRHRREFIVDEGHAGLLYEHGRFVGSLAAGRHILWGARYRVSLLNLRDLVSAWSEPATPPSGGGPKVTIVSGAPVYVVHLAPAEIESERPRQTEIDRRASIAGVPLWLVRSEQANPGGLLREMLLTQPSRYD